MTLIGENDELRRTVESLSTVVDVNLEETGAYHPDVGTLTTLLTDRQRQILEIAVDRGYYEVPRRVTHDEIAAACGLSQSTVAEHLQKIEATILPRVVE